MPQIKMTFEEAVHILSQYDEWRHSKAGISMPRAKKVSEAIQIAIHVLQDIVDGQSISHPSRIALENIYELCKNELHK